MLQKGKTKKIHCFQNILNIDIFSFFCDSFPLASDFWILLKSKHLLLITTEPLKTLLSTEPPLPSQIHFLYRENNEVRAGP